MHLWGVQLVVPEIEAEEKMSLMTWLMLKIQEIPKENKSQTFPVQQ